MGKFPLSSYAPTLPSPSGSAAVAQESYLLTGIGTGYTIYY